MNKVSIVICIKNSADHLQEVINSCKNVNPFEVIVIDANSNDGTYNICHRNKVKIYYDNGTGLGNARNLGLEKSIGDYILYVGSDNLLKNNLSLDSIIEEMELNNWKGIGIRSRMIRGFKVKNLYLYRGLDQRWIKKINPGEKSVIGTPFLFNRKILKSFKFATDKKYSDDSELCYRFKIYGFMVGYTKEVLCGDMWLGPKQSIVERFINYGKSDNEYFKEHYHNWSLLRCIKSLTHPFTEFKIIDSIKMIKYIPFICLIVVLRYYGYIRG